MNANGHGFRFASPNTNSTDLRCVGCGVLTTYATRGNTPPCPFPERAWVAKAHQSTHFDIVYDGHVWLQDPVSRDHACEGCLEYVPCGSTRPLLRCPTPHHHLVDVPSGAYMTCSECQQTWPHGSLVALAGCTGASTVPAAYDLFSVESSSPPAPEKPRCIQCSVEVSPYLDAYYGRDPVKALQCANCRDGRAYT